MVSKLSSKTKPKTLSSLKVKLIRFSKKLRFFLWLYEKEFIKKIVGSDVKYFFELIEILNKMGKNAK